MDLESSQVSKRPSFFETRLDIAYSYIGWSDIFYNTYSGSACRKVPDIVVPIGRLSILEHFDWIIEICFPK